MSISTPFIRRPVATSLLTAALVLVGLAAYPFLPVAPLPRVEFPTISVTASYPGASPETMAAATGKAIRANTGHGAAHLGQRPGPVADHPAV
jgi:multidrug efflux pump subunit AcrB